MEETEKHPIVKSKQSKKSKPLQEQGLRVKDLDDVLQERPGIRTYVLRFIFIGLLVIAGTLLAFRSTIENYTGTAPFIHTHTYFIYSNISDGTVLLNGKVIATHLPATITVQTWFRQPTNFTLTLNAKPFNDVACHIVADVDTTSHCLNNIPISFLDGNIVVPNNISKAIYIPISDAQLGKTDQQALLNAIHTSFMQMSSPIQIPSGEHYEIQQAQGNPELHISAAPITALLSPMVSPGFQPETCQFLCSSQPFITAISTGTQSEHNPGVYWSIFINTKLMWQFYTTSSKQLIGIMPEAGSGTTAINTTYIMSVLWKNGAWTISFITPKLDPKPYTNAVSQNGIDATINATKEFPNSNSMYGLYTASDCQETQGCLEQYTVNQYDAQGNYQGIRYAIFLWRFGVLYAANQNAHISNPTVPVANWIDLQPFQNSTLWWYN